MQSRKRNIVSRIIGAALCVASMSFAFSSCENIYEDLDPCAHGVSLRFIYDYNMEFANAFPKKVDCLTLYIYDEEGNYVDTRVVTGPELRDESYRMTLDLAPGKYRFITRLVNGKQGFYRSLSEAIPIRIIIYVIFMPLTP